MSETIEDEPCLKCHNTYTCKRYKKACENFYKYVVNNTVQEPGRPTDYWYRMVFDIKEEPEPITAVIPTLLKTIMDMRKQLGRTWTLKKLNQLLDNPVNHKEVNDLYDKGLLKKTVNRKYPTIWEIAK